MVRQYNLLLPRQVVFGWGRRAELPELAAAPCRRVFLVRGSRTLDALGLIDEIAGGLRTSGVEVVDLTTVSREPLVEDVDDVQAQLLSHRVSPEDGVIAVGGGAAIDLGKAAAALATNQHGDSVQDFLEGVGRGFTLKQHPLPFIAVPTTAGTGSEATKNAVISSTDPQFKKSLRSDWMMPQTVVIDPELTVSAPPTVTAHSGMDALTQLIESYVSCRAQPVTRALCIEGLQAGLPAVEEAYRNGNSRPAREAMAHAAFLSGVALANSGLGIAHGVAAALGVHCNAPHGLACAVMLPVALKLNRSWIMHDLARLARLTLQLEIASDEEAARCFIERIEQICRHVGIPDRLSEIGATAGQIPDIVRSSHGNSRRGNPREISDDELAQVLEESL
ncbi:MAG: iron-containing alcohol dehydrogenase [Planctomycetota bacterium]|nr:MAG: iron-containing alcohol dehydrogenase [Planctomycetota bacterium]